MTSGPPLPILHPWTWLPRLPRAVAAEVRLAASRFWATRHTLWAVTVVDYRKKYAGSILGALWYPLYAALLLGVYTFVYMVIFQARYSDFGRYDYVLFIFAGLVPYIGFSDAVSTTTPSIKANLVLIRNTVFPVELIPLRQLFVSLAGLGFSLAVLIALVLPTSFLGWHLLYLPVPLLLLLLFTAGLTWILSALAVLVPDLTYVVNLLLLLFMFVSPIGFTITQVPTSARLAVLANPMTYLIESFRFALLGLRTTPLWYDAIFGVLALILAALGVSFFRTLMPVFSDYE